MLHEFQLERKASEAAKFICSGFDQKAVSARKCHRWFQDFFLNGSEALCPILIKKLLKLSWSKNNQIAQQQLAITLNCSQEIISNQLSALRKVQKFEICVF